MLIDWFTVVAQVVNFLILVWLLKRFLYKPILNAIDEREKKIAKQLADADAKQGEAQKQRDEFQRKNDEFEQQRTVLMNKAIDESQTERRRLLEEARNKADSLSEKRRETLSNDAHVLNQALAQRTRQEVFSITRKALTDLADVTLEERMAAVFIRRLRALDEPTKNSFGATLKNSAEPVIVRSAFELSVQQRSSIQNALNETFSENISVRFESVPDMVSGIELISNGQKVAWSIADYLATMEKNVDELLKEKERAKPGDIKIEAKRA